MIAHYLHPKSVGLWGQRLACSDFKPSIAGSALDEAEEIKCKITLKNKSVLILSQYGSTCSLKTTFKINNLNRF